MLLRCSFFQLQINGSLFQQLNQTGNFTNNITNGIIAQIIAVTQGANSSSNVNSSSADGFIASVIPAFGIATQPINNSLAIVDVLITLLAVLEARGDNSTSMYTQCQKYKTTILVFFKPI